MNSLCKPILGLSNIISSSENGIKVWMNYVIAFNRIRRNNWTSQYDNVISNGGNYSMKRFMKQIGQGMTEYIIIVALVAIAAIGAYTFFGDSLKGALGGIAEELSGTDATADMKSRADATEAFESKDMSDFSESDK